MRALPLLAFALMSACVLHTKEPAFDDAAAVLLFGQKPVTFAVYDRKDGVWTANEEPLAALVPSGRHYDMADPSAENPAKVDSYFFIPLDGTHLVVQAVSGGEADYGIASWDGKELLASPLDCARLKTRLKTNDLVGFDDDACTLLPSQTPVLERFAKLAQRSGASTLRFVRQ